MVTSFKLMLLLKMVVPIDPGAHECDTRRYPDAKTNGDQYSNEDACASPNGDRDAYPTNDDARTDRDTYGGADGYTCPADGYTSSGTDECASTHKYAYSTNRYANADRNTGIDAYCGYPEIAKPLWA